MSAGFSQIDLQLREGMYYFLKGHNYTIYIHCITDYYAYLLTRAVNQGNHQNFNLFTANILLVKKATFHCLLFPILFQCTFGSQTTVLNEVEII